MALEIKRGTAGSLSGLVADRRLYLTADQDRVVEEGSPDVAFLLATPGAHIPPDVVARLGLALLAGKIVQQGAEDATPESEPAPVPEPKSAQGKRRARKPGK